MSRYLLRLHDGPTTPPLIEALDADDDEEARALAEMRLLLTRDYTHIHVYEGERQIAEFHRTLAGQQSG